MYDDEFPLRMEPRGDESLIKFEGFVDKLGPAIDMTHSEAEKQAVSGSRETEGEEEYAIREIIGTKMKGRKQQYIVLWDTKEVSLEPKEGLHPDLIKEYESRIEQAALTVLDPNPNPKQDPKWVQDATEINRGTACVDYTVNSVHALLTELKQKEKMIGELIHKQKQKGTVKDWEQGVLEEFAKVRDSRFEEVDEETKAKVLRENLAMRLRMILEAKKDGRMKGRLVGQGFLETLSQYGSKTDAPVASLTAMRMLLFMGGEEGDVIASGDIAGAFLAADDYPEGAEPRFVSFREYRGGPVHVWRLKGPLYGSKDSPYKWWESFCNFVTKVQSIVDKGFIPDKGQGTVDDIIESAASNFQRGIDEPCVFYNPHTGMRLVLYVDDMITRGSETATRQFYTALNDKYPLRSWDILTPDTPLQHLGFTITEEVREGRTYRYISQEKDVMQFLDDNNITLTKEVECPMPSRHAMLKKDRLLNAEEIKQFRSLVGSLGFYSVSLRYDISRSVCRVQQMQSAPTEGALEAAIRIAAYVGCTSDFRIGGAVVNHLNEVEYYTDSDHAGDAGITYRSHTGIMITLNDIPIQWKSQQQPKTVLSPAEAEIFACSEGLKQANWVRWIAKDLQIKFPSVAVLQVDNDQVRSFVNATCAKSRLRTTISMRWAGVQELRQTAEEGACVIKHVRTDKNKADILTKCLEAKEFKRQVEQVQGSRLKFKRKDEVLLMTIGNGLIGG